MCTSPIGIKLDPTLTIEPSKFLFRPIKYILRLIGPRNVTGTHWVIKYLEFIMDLNILKIGPIRISKGIGLVLWNFKSIKQKVMYVLCIVSLDPNWLRKA